MNIIFQSLFKITLENMCNLYPIQLHFKMYSPKYPSINFKLFFETKKTYYADRLLRVSVSLFSHIIIYVE